MENKSFREAVGNKPAVFIYELRAQPDISLSKRIPYLGIRNQGVIALSKKDDIILLQELPDESYISWLDSINFEHGKIHKINTDPKKLLTKSLQELPKEEIKKILPKDYILVPRMATPDAHQVSDYLEKPLFGANSDLMMKYYDKASFKKICENLNLPIVPYVYLKDQDTQNYKQVKNALSEIISNSDAALVKQLTASAGAGSFVVKKESLEDAVKLITENELYKEGILIESFISIKEEYSSQWAMDVNYESNLIGISLMHADKKNAHKGNSYPLKENQQDVLNNSVKLVSDMAKKGYVGNTQIDLLKSKDCKIYLSENNTRISGSSFAWEIYDRILKENKDQTNFLSSRFRINKPISFMQLQNEISDLLFDGQKGLFPYDIGALPINGTFFGLITAKNYENIAKQLDVLSRKGIKSDVLAINGGYE